MTVAVVTLTSRARAGHLERQQRWLDELAAGWDQDHIRVVVHLDPEPPAPLPQFARSGPAGSESARSGSADPGPAGSASACVTLHVPPGPGGLRLAAGRNAGATAAIDRGADVLCFLDVDCLPHPDLLPRYASEVGRRLGVLACGPVTYLPPDVLPDAPADAHRHLAPHPARPAPDPGTSRPATADETDLFWSLSFACSRDTWLGTGGFDEGYEGYGGEDTDFAQTAAAAGARLTWVGGAHALHQYHPTASPPWQHLDDILRNGALFARRWGRWPMEGWLDAFARAGAIERDGSGWRRVASARIDA